MYLSGLSDVPPGVGKIDIWFYGEYQMLILDKTIKHHSFFSLGIFSDKPLVSLRLAILWLQLFRDDFSE